MVTLVAGGAQPGLLSFRFPLLWSQASPFPEVLGSPVQAQLLGGSKRAINPCPLGPKSRWLSSAP